MKCFIIFLILSPIAAPVLARNVLEEDSIGSFSLWNSISQGIISFGSLINNIKDIFNVILNENSEILIDISVPISEDAFLNITQLATKYGYVMEKHTVTTEDGYVLSLQRIPYSRNGFKNGRVIFLMHGILDSSDSWVLQGPNLSLAYILSDEGYDVWMGNARGNKYSLTHEKLSVTEPAFWEFTWEEIGIKDLPAMIDYTLNVTGRDSLYYVGHSQGTTSFYVMNSLKPEYNNKINMMFSLAPVAWMTHAKSPIVRIFSPAYKVLGYLLSNFNTYSPTTEFFNKIISIVCSFYSKRCENSLFMITGNVNMINSTMLPVILGHMPSGSSTHQFVHYGQLVENGKFCRFDFGKEKNLLFYGIPEPPEYDLSEISVPISLYYSDSDLLSDPSDVEILKGKLPNVLRYSLVPGFSHLDYMYAPEAKELIYLKIVNEIDEFENVIV